MDIRLHYYLLSLLPSLSLSLSPSLPPPLPAPLPPPLPPPLPVFLSYIHTLLTHSIVNLSEVALELLCKIVHISFASVLGTVCSTEDFYLLTYASFWLLCNHIIIHNNNDNLCINDNNKP